MSRSQKGSSFERDFARTLSLWWTTAVPGGPFDDAFWRTSNSGGRATVRGRRGKATRGHYGDIAATDEIGKPFLEAFTLELKRGYNHATVADLMDKPAEAKMQQYETWFEKAQASKEASGSLAWMLVHKRDRREPVIFCPLSAFNKLNVHPLCTFDDLEDETCDSAIGAMPLECFFEQVSPEAIRNWLHSEM